MEIEGIEELQNAKLGALGINDTDALLERGKTAQGRKELSELTGISKDDILRWVNYADLMRIKGVAGQFSELLERAGVDTVKEFRHRVPANLHKRLEEVNAEFNLCGRVPTLAEVENMVAQAKELPTMVEY